MKTELEIQREKMREWNERRASNEIEGILKFWKLKECFKKQKDENAVSIGRGTAR